MHRLREERIEGEKGRVGSRRLGRKRPCDVSRVERKKKGKMRKRKSRLLIQIWKFYIVGYLIAY